MGRGKAVPKEELDIRLFGGLRVAGGGQPVAGLDSPRQQALLAWLLLHADAPQSRRRIAFAFWPDSSERQALTNLRRELHHLRQALPDAECFLEVTPQTIRWRPDTPARLDTAQFERALSAALADSGQPRRAGLEQAVALYQGELVAGVYDDWLEPVRQRFHQRGVEALEQLATLYEQQGEIERAVACAQRLVELEPVCESAYARLMRLHLARGDRALALRTFHRCAQVLEQELGAQPSGAVRRAYEEHLSEVAGEPPPMLPDVLPLIGRKKEWTQLLTLWREVPGAGAGAVFISGEAGIGKTRLAEALLAKAEDEDALAARTRSYAAEGRLAFAPLSDWLRSPALQANLARLEAPWLAELARLLPELLQRHPQLPTPQPLTEGWQRQRLFEALARAFLAADAPLLLLFDDLQWCDRDTLEWLHYLLRFAPRAPWLLLGTLRSEERDDNRALSELLRHLQQQELLHLIELGPLDSEESAALAASVAERTLDPAVQARLVTATEGQPLFIVEAIRAGLAFDDDGGAHCVAASPRVHAVIDARLAQLSDAARGVAQLAATIGRAFDVEVLRAAGDLDEEPLVSALDELWRRLIIREQQGGARPSESYDFSHDRLREGAYAELSPARRRLLHRRVAQALERLNGADLERVSAQLAAHYEQAGESDQAIGFYQQAVERANDVSASREAIRLARRALALLEQRPASAAHDRRDLALHNALAAALSALRGFTPPELEAVLNRARQLAEALGDEAAVIRSLWGLYALHIVRGNIRLARSLAEQALRLAGEDSGLLTDCQQALGGVDLTEGNLAAASAHFAVANRLYRRHRARRVLFGADVGVFSLAWGSHGLWLQGEIEQAREQVAQAETIAAELGHPFTTMQASAYRSIYWQLERRLDTAWSSAEATVAGCDEHNVGYYREWGVIVGGWVQALRGEPGEGSARIRRGLEALRRQDAHLRRPYYLSLLAEVCLARDESDEARALLDAAMTIAEQNRDLWWLPELWRLRGLTEAGAQAEACFRRAASIADQQGSRSLALRAALSLADRLREDGRPREAIAQLEPLCAAFPAHLESHDLAAVRALLNTR